MPNKILLTIGAALLLLCLAFSVLSFLRQPKIAFVRSQELVYGFAGTQEAKAKFDVQKQQWQSNVDTLRVDLQRGLNRYNQDLPSLSEELKNEQQQLLQQQERQFLQYSQSIEGQIQQADEEMMQGVLNQVNSLVKEYAKENGYDMILGSTLSGSILYGKDEMDITEQLLEDLNKNYRGE